MALQIKTTKIFVYSFIDLFLKMDAQIFKFKSAFKNKKFALKSPKSALFQPTASCLFLFFFFVKYWNRENFRIPVFEGFTCFGMS